MRIRGAAWHEASTRQLGAVSPLALATGQGLPGDRLGNDCYGRAFRFDPFDAYAAGAVTNPNVLVFGQIGRGKSALVKSLIHRSLARGRRAWVVDPKGEYGELCHALGGSWLKLVPGGSLRLNPIETGDPLEAAALVCSLLATSLGRRLLPVERAAVELALDGSTNLAEVAGGLLEPNEAAAAALSTTRERLAEDGRDLGLELRRMVAGDLAGMFDGSTSPEVDAAAKLAVVDLSATYGTDAMGLVVTCALAALQAKARDDQCPGLLVVDEAWAVLRDHGTAEWLQASWKLARSRGLANVAVLHRPSDLEVAGGAKGELAGIARGLIADSETKVLYAQAHAELEAAAGVLGLSAHETALLPGLARGHALWMVGGQVHAVRHELLPEERAWCNTDGAMAEA